MNGKWQSSWFLRAGPKCLKFCLKDIIYCLKSYAILTQSEKENLFVALYESASRDESNEPFPAYLQLFFSVEI